MRATRAIHLQAVGDHITEIFVERTERHSSIQVGIEKVSLADVAPIRNLGGNGAR